MSMLLHEGIQLGPTRLPHREVTHRASAFLKCLCILGARRAVQVEESANIDMPRFARVEAVENFSLNAREKMRYGVARGQHGNRIEKPDFFR